MSFIDINHYYDSISSNGGGWIDKTVPTLVGVLIGFGLNRAYELYKDKKEITRSGEDFINELNLLTESLNNQLASLDKAIEQMVAKELTPPNVTINIAFVGERFNSIDRLRVFKHFHKAKKQEGRTIDNHLYALIKRIEIDATRIEKYYDQYVNTSQEYFDLFHKAVNSMLREFSEEVAKTEKKGIELETDPLMADALPMLSKFSKSQKLNLVELTEQICYPLLEITGKHRMDERIKIISKQNAVCFDSYKGTLEAKNLFAVRLRQIKESIENVKQELNTKISQCPQ